VTGVERRHILAMLARRNDDQRRGRDAPRTSNRFLSVSAAAGGAIHEPFR
jgi:hypothetical protein